MIRIKNLRAGRLFVTDAGLKLLPGQVISVENISLQTQGLIDKGYVAQVDSPSKKVEKEISPTIPKKYEELHAAEAIEYVDKIADPLLLKTILKEEKRKTVIEAIEQRLKTLKPTS